MERLAKNNFQILVSEDKPVTHRQEDGQMTPQYSFNFDERKNRIDLNSAQALFKRGKRYYLQIVNFAGQGAFFILKTDIILKPPPFTPHSPEEEEFEHTSENNGHLSGHQPEFSESEILRTNQPTKLKPIIDEDELGLRAPLNNSGEDTENSTERGGCSCSVL